MLLMSHLYSFTIVRRLPLMPVMEGRGLRRNCRQKDRGVDTDIRVRPSRRGRHDFESSVASLNSILSSARFARAQAVRISFITRGAPRDPQPYPRRHCIYRCYPLGSIHSRTLSAATINHSEEIPSNALRVVARGCQPQGLRVLRLQFVHCFFESQLVVLL